MKCIETQKNHHLEETFAGRVKLMPQNRKIEIIGLPITQIKILTLNKQLTRLSVLLAQIKAGINSYKLKNEIRQILLLYLLYQHNKFTKEQFNQFNIIMGLHIEDSKLLIPTEPKIFHLPKDVDKSLKHEFDSIMKKYCTFS